MKDSLDWQKETFLEEMDSPEEARELLQVFELSSESLLSEIEKALAEGNLPLVREKAHALKGACATIFFERARLLAYDLEKAADLETAKEHFAQLQKMLKEFQKVIANF
ncbi:MAG: Hpt domain-containing protein [Thermodesulfobacteria bacterium]|nr:Hpt domain-containing protein [Thermodesulfobacteriota bacterium]